jgi:O-antigen ligase
MMRGGLGASEPAGSPAFGASLGAVPMAPATGAPAQPPRRSVAQAVSNDPLPYLGLLAYLFMLYIRPTEWLPGFRLLPGDYLLVIVAVGAGFLVAGGRYASPKPMITPWLAGWIVMILLSNFRNFDPITGIGQAILYGKRVLLPLLFWLALTSRARFRGVIALMVAQSALLGIQAIYHAQHGVGWAGQPLDSDDRVTWIGIFDGSNVFSALLLPAVPFCLEMVLGKWRFPWKVFAIVSGSLIMAGLYLANSRGAWLALFVMLVLYFHGRLGKFGVVIGAAAVVVAVAFGPSRLGRIDNEEKSAMQRIEMWAQGNQMLKERPLFGIGKGKYGQYTGALIAHNTFLQNMGETGLLGLFVWMALIYASFKSLYTVYKYRLYMNRMTLSLGRATFVAWMGYLAAAFFVTLDFDVLYVLMGLSAGVLTLAYQDVKGLLPINALKIRMTDLRNLAVLEVLGIIFMYFTIRTLPHL